MKKNMRAALDDGRGRYVVQDFPMPEKLKDYALIRIRQSGICGSDLHLTTKRLEDNEKQLLPGGHEIAGEITYTGAPFRFTDLEWKINTSAPKLSQHTKEILKEVIGIPEKDLSILKANGTI